MEKLLEDGPWMNRNVPIILNEWSPSVNLVKEDIMAIPVWVKMHDVPLAAFTEDGLSLLASKIGDPKMLDSYTASMCAESWGRSSFARALIEVHAGSELKRTVKVAVLGLDGSGFSMAEVKVEYDWEPLRCATCCVFGHDGNLCTKNPKTVVEEGSKSDADGFRELKGKNKKGGQQGFQVNNKKPKMVYRPITKAKNQSDKASSSTDQVKVSNSFDVLQDEEVVNRMAATNAKPVQQMKSINKGSKGYKDQIIIDDIGVDDLLDEIPKFMDRKIDGNKSEGASTPGNEVSNG
ncbi:uncharacterized protein LOC110870598 [Helianthus annuus]|uniref:uncharacterized protein LOC110870598 n=1 Tax=Helianthus annuus TaxID=4232 RepID=UPI000B8F1D3F|nr:uncharacterized protein LOC110870598 [Helianthus annuus]